MTDDPRRDEAIRLLEGWLYDPTQDEHTQAHELERLIRSLNRSNDMPDSILKSALYGRLMAAALSGAGAMVAVLDQTQIALTAALAIVGAALAAASKVREWLKTRPQ
jgi:hypothetical protein